MRRFRMLVSAGTIVALTAVGIAYAAGAFTVKATEFDPGKTHLVQGAWLEGTGCPTNATTATPNASFTDIAGFGTYTDPACATGDSSDRKVEGLVLAKTGPSITNFASAGAEIHGVKGEALTELGWDIRKPGAGLSAGERGSHCGAGAPRWNISTKDGRFFFLGCNSPPAPSQTAGDGFVRMRWGGSAALLAFEPAAGFALVNIAGQRIERLTIVFDEGYDTGPDNFGLAVLDNIDVNGVMVGRGSTDSD